MIDVPPAKIQIFIPYYGRRDHAQTAIRSVLEQTAHAWTLCVVQDGPDVEDLGDWIRDLSDDRVTYQTNHDGLGVAGNFQRCLDLATGSHVVFLGCDDALAPGYVQLVSVALDRHPGAAAVHPGVAVMDVHGNPVRPAADRVKRLLTPRPSESAALSGEHLMTSLLRGNWAYFPAVCWDRKRVARFGFRQDLPVTLDLALLADIVLDGGEVVVLPDTLFRYRRHAFSVSSVAARSLDRFAEEVSVFNELGDACRTHGWNRAARAARWHATSRLHAATLLPRTLVHGDATGAVRLLRHVVAS